MYRLNVTHGFNLTHLCELGPMCIKFALFFKEYGICYQGKYKIYITGCNRKLYWMHRKPSWMHGWCRGNLKCMHVFVASARFIQAQYLCTAQTVVSSLNRDKCMLHQGIRLQGFLDPLYNNFNCMCVSNMTYLWLHPIWCIIRNLQVPAEIWYSVIVDYDLQNCYLYKVNTSCSYTWYTL